VNLKLIYILLYTIVAVSVCDLVPRTSAQGRRLLNELRLRRDIARPDNQVDKLELSPAQIYNNLATLSDSELTWIWFTLIVA
jgi:hypothetical protein